VPKFSIVVPAYNAESTLAETLDAVLAQELEDWECVVVDDGSTDSTLAIATSYEQRDPRLRVLHQENQGTGGAYNTGVSAAVGDFIVLCSADDVLLPELLAEMSALVDAYPDYEIYSSDGCYLQHDGSRTPVHNATQLAGMETLTLSDVIRWCFYGVGAAYRREIFESVGGYRQDVYGEDYDFWLRAMAGGARHKFTPKSLSLHRLSPTRKSANLERAYRSDIRIVSDLRRDFDLTGDQLAAADESILAREKLIAELHDPHVPTPREKAVGAAVRLLGEENVSRLGRLRRSGRGKRDGE
jgi:glycosyltransferase involved in cell wall biosynthesis